MKLLYICDALANHGGLERVVIDKANWFVEHGGYEVYLLTTNQPGHPVSFPLHPDVSYYDLGICFHHQYRFSGLRRQVKRLQLKKLFRKRLTEKIAEWSPDVIICTCFDYLHDIVGVKGGIPLVFESHASRLAALFLGDGLLRRFYVWYSQRAVRHAQMVVALTQGDALEWKKLTPHVCVIPNLVHLNESGLYTDWNAQSAIFVGRFTKQKDIGSLLRIWSLVYQRHPDWRLHIYGESGEEQASLLEKIKQMDANIQVHKPTPDIIEKYRESSVMLLTSVCEPFGLVLPEAMSCGLPVIAFDCPYGPADIITEGVDGFLIQDRSIEAYAEKVSLLIEHQELRRKMGTAGIASTRRYEASNVMPLWKELFTRLANK